MSRLFISHSSRNDDWAIALRDWLVREGWSGEHDIFLDLDPERGIVAGQRWFRALEDAATRCEFFLVSEDWLASKWCWDEYQLAKELNKKLFALLVEDIPVKRLPGGLTAQWQVVNLLGDPAERFLTVHPRTERPSPVHVAKSGLASLKRGLEKAGIGAETFDLQPDPEGPFGWRAAYRGLEALEPEDAAVFFGRNADIVRGIDALRGLAAHKPPRLLVVLGASGAGKSSFLRAGLWPRLLRDDSQWLPLRAIRASRGGAIEGDEGLLESLADAHAHLALRKTRSALRARLETPDGFVALLNELRQAAARRALLDLPPYPLPVLCLDQGEELFTADAGTESAKLLQLSRAAIDADAMLLLVTIRSDYYGHMQSANVLADVEHVALPLGPVPQGEIGRIIREPSELLRRKAGPQAPVFDAGVVERLQHEVAAESDALPLLAFVLQRLMREHYGTATIGVAELERTGGVAAAIENEAEAALAEAGYGPDRSQRRDVLRRLFIPRLVRIDRETKLPQRRVARQRDVPIDLAPLARALTERRLLVARVVAEVEPEQSVAATLEVAHEALLRRWPSLADLLAEDRDALLLLDGVLLAANDWKHSEPSHEQDFLTHRGSRLADAQALRTRGPDWGGELAPAAAYLAACETREIAEQEEREAELRRAEEAVARAQAALTREQKALANVTVAQTRTARLQRRGRWTLAVMAIVVALGLAVVGGQYRDNLGLRASLSTREKLIDRTQANLLGELARVERLRGNLDGALRFAVYGTRYDLASEGRTASTAAAELVTALSQSALLSLPSAGSGVRTAVFSQDGTRILTASLGAAQVWNAEGREIAFVSGHGYLMYTAAFSPDGSRIVTASQDKTARVWDDSGKELAVLRGHEDAVISAAFSPDGLRVVTASRDKTARIWNSNGGEITILRGHGVGGVVTAAFSPDGMLVVTAGDDGTARLWNAATGREIKVLRAEGRLQSAAFSPDGSRILTVLGDTSTSFPVRIWDLSGKEIAVLRGHMRPVRSAAFSSDGSRIVTASDDRTARVWDANSGKEITALRGHLLSVSSAAFSPDGSHIVTASRDKTARVWDVITGREIAALRGHGEGLESASFSLDGSRIVTASSDETARVWGGVREIPVQHELARVHAAAFSPDGSRIVTASDDKTARLWDTSSGKRTAVLQGHAGTLRSAAFSSDGSRIVTASDDKTARLWDANGKEIAVLRGHENGVNEATFSQDGSRILTASYDKTARVWDASGREIAVLRGHGNRVVSASFSLDGSRIVTASDDGTARLWDIEGREINVLRHDQARVTAAKFSPDGSRIVTATDGGTVRLWNAATGQELFDLRIEGGGYLQDPAFSPDGDRIAAASHNDKTARLWDANGREIAALRGHENRVYSAVFSPNGSRIVTTSADSTARIWDAITGREITVLGHEVPVFNFGVVLDEPPRYTAAFSPDGSSVVTILLWKARLWSVPFEMMSTNDALVEVCTRRLLGRTKLSRDEMRLAGYADDEPEIDACH